jgi:DNA-binding SARP family transcriptional activator/tetratricopeptide (TPR) repeat protein
MQGQIHVGATKVRGLLGFLSYKANELVHVDRITEALWDDNPPTGAGKALQTYASRLRRVFRDADCPAELTNEHRSYRLDIDMSTVDYYRFKATVRDAGRARAGGDHQTAAELYAAALALWDGPPFADLDTNWARAQRATLTTRDLIPAHCALCDTMLSLGDVDSVLNGLSPLLSDHPTNESLAARWIRALAAAGRADEVPVFYREFATRLRDDLATSPSAELRRAAEAAMTRHPAPAPRRRPNPPRDTPYFTGREALLTELDVLLANRAVDVVALDGPPGIGKTSLVTHWARSRESRFPGGVLHVDLAGYADTPVMDPHAVMAMFLAELGVPPTRIPDSTSERATQLRDLLSTRDVLVFLDNARDSNHVRPLLEATSPSPALITSRQRLTGITYRDGVQLVSIPALTRDEATALLTTRMGTRATDDPEAFAQLVDLCQGLPLALQIVGEHVAMRPAAPIGELTAELGQAKRLLDAGSHGDDHTTTLRSTFSLSYRALREPERRLFRLLGLHPGTRFSVQAVHALAGTDEVEPVLDALVGGHLVAQEGAGRYYVHDLLHVYAAETAQLDEPSAHRARAIHRLFDWYLRSARRARSHLLGTDQDVPDLAPIEPVAALTFTTNDEALRWLVTERANLVACAYRAAALGYDEHVWRLAACLNVLNRHEDPRDLLEIHDLARRSAERLGDLATVGGCWNNKGAIHARLNDEKNAARCFDLAHEAFSAAGDNHGLAACIHNMGYLYLRLGRPMKAIASFNTALTMHANSERDLAKDHRCLGDAYLKLDRLDEARSHYRQSLFASQKIADEAGQAKSLYRLAKLNADEDHLADAVTYGEEALAMFDRVQVDQGGTANALCVLAETHLRAGNPAKAITMAREAVDRFREVGDINGQIDGLLLLGRALASSGERLAAANTWAAAELLTSAMDDRRSELRGLLAAEADQSLPAQRTADEVGGGHTPTPVELPEDVG